MEYDSWYSESLAIIKQLLPDRSNDFIKQYKDEKRKEILAYFHQSFDRYESLFSVLKND